MRITDQACERLAGTMLAQPVEELRAICAETIQGAWHVAAALAMRHRDMGELAIAVKAAVGGAPEGAGACGRCARYAVTGYGETADGFLRPITTCGGCDENH